MKNNFDQTNLETPVEHTHRHLIHNRLFMITGLCACIISLIYIAQCSNAKCANMVSRDTQVTENASSTLPVVEELANSFVATPEIEIKRSQGINFEERVTDIVATYADGYSFKIDSNFIEPVLDVSKFDINFDGTKDIRVDVSTGAYNTGTVFYTQDPSTRSFTRYNLTGYAGDEEGELSPGLGYVSIKDDGHTLTSYYKARGLGDLYSLETYKFTSGSWKLTSTQAQDTYDIKGTPPSDGFGPYYINTITDYTKTPPVMTTKYFKLIEIGSEPRFEEISKPTK